MNLLTAGYWQSQFFPKAFWHEAFWQGFGVTAQTNVYSALRVFGLDDTYRVFKQDTKSRSFTVTDGERDFYMQ